MQQRLWICNLLAFLSFLLRSQAFLSKRLVSFRVTHRGDTIIRSTAGHSETPLFSSEASDFEPGKSLKQNAATQSGNSKLDGRTLNGTVPGSREDMTHEIRELCVNGEFERAIEIIRRSDAAVFLNGSLGSTDIHSKSTLKDNEHGKISDANVEPSQLDRISFPTAQTFEMVIKALCKTMRHDSAEKCDECLKHLWHLYNETKDERLIPTQSCYVETIRAFSRSGGGRRAAEMAENLFHEMETLKFQFPHLEPTTVCANAVL